MKLDENEEIINDSLAGIIISRGSRNDPEEAIAGRKDLSESAKGLIFDLKF